MNHKRYCLLMFSLLSTVSIAEERLTLKFDALPDAVRTTVAHYIQPDKITKIEKITDTGYSKYFIQSTKTVNNNNFIGVELTVSNDGEIIKMAKEAPYFAIPFPVMSQLNQRYPNLKVDEVESVQARYFHLTGKNNGQPINLEIDDDGEIKELDLDPDQQPQNPPDDPKVISTDTPVTPP